MRSLTVFGIALVVAGCTPSLGEIETGEPDWTVEYTEQAPEPVRECVKSKLVRQSGGTISLTEYNEDNYRALAKQLVGTYGPEGIIWATHFYDRRAEVFGMKYAFGRYGEDVLPAIRDCTS